MNTIIMEGRVLPENRAVTINNLESIRYRDPRGFEAVFDIKIEDSEIQIKCTGSTEINSLPEMSIVRAYELVTSLVDLYAFSKGWALHVILDNFTVNGVRQGIALSQVSAAPFCTTISNENDFHEIWELLLSNFELKFAFRDLISSLSTLNYSSIAASRALDSIRKSIAPDGSTESESWRILREKLQIERMYLQFITDSSREPRHGNRGAAVGEDQLEVTHRIWKIMNRYIEYLKRGATEKLCQEEFPLLIK